MGCYVGQNTGSDPGINSGPFENQEGRPPVDQTTPPITETPAPTGTIDGKVIHSEGIDGPYTVQIIGRENDFSVETDEDDKFLFTNVPTGLHSIKGGNKYSQTEIKDVYVTENETAPTELKFNLSIPSMKESTVTVVVLLDGEPIAGANVWINREQEVFATGESGKVSMCTLIFDQHIFATFGERWGLTRIRSDLTVIELFRKSFPPPLPEGMVLTEGRPCLGPIPTQLKAATAGPLIGP